MPTRSPLASLSPVRIHPGLLVFAAVSCLALILTLIESNRDVPIRPAQPVTRPEQLPISPPREPAQPQQQEREATQQQEREAIPLLGRASVIDGDTIDIHGARIRLSGIDAPESSQTCEASGKTYRCGQRASMALSDFLEARTVECSQSGTDRWHRILAKCRVGGADIGEWMVSEGWAIAYRKYSLEYVSAEETARIAKRGIWAGTFIPPEEWRKGNRKGDAHVNQ